MYQEKSNFRTVATGSCLTLSFGNKIIIIIIKKNDCAQHNELGVSFVSQVVWNTEPVRFFFFFLWTFCIFPRARVGLVKKKRDEKHRKKAHGFTEHF